MQTTYMTVYVRLGDHRFVIHFNLFRHNTSGNVSGRKMAMVHHGKSTSTCLNGDLKRGKSPVGHTYAVNEPPYSKFFRAGGRMCHSEQSLVRNVQTVLWYPFSQRAGPP